MTHLDASVHQTNTDITPVFRVPNCNALIWERKKTLVCSVDALFSQPNDSVCPKSKKKVPETEYLSTALDRVKNPDVSVRHRTSKVRSSKKRSEEDDYNCHQDPYQSGELFNEGSKGEDRDDYTEHDDHDDYIDHDDHDGHDCHLDNHECVRNQDLQLQIF